MTRLSDNKEFIGKLLIQTTLEEFAVSYDREFKTLNEIQGKPGVVKIEDYYFFNQAN